MILEIYFSVNTYGLSKILNAELLLVYFYILLKVRRSEYFFCRSLPKPSEGLWRTEKQHVIVETQINNKNNGQKMGQSRSPEFTKYSLYCIGGTLYGFIVLIYMGTE